MPTAITPLQPLPNIPTKPKAKALWQSRMVGPRGLEPLTPSMSRKYSNQLSYEPTMPGEGLEPSGPCGRRILSPLCLPISSPRRIKLINTLYQITLEAWTGLEPVNSCFADNSLSLLGTTPYLILSITLHCGCSLIKLKYMLYFRDKNRSSEIEP